MRADCVASVSPFLADLSQALSDQDLAKALSVLEKIRKFLDAQRS
jgi:hypothetical protein